MMEVKPPTRNHRFFVDTVYFQAEDEIYKVPKKPFTDNSHTLLSNLLTLPLPKHESDHELERIVPEGMSEDHPIRLEGVLKVDFDRFLTVLLVNPPFQAKLLYETMTRDDWLSVLKLATLWSFLAIRYLAIHYLGLMPRERFSALDRIVAARQYKVVQWFIAGVVGVALDTTGHISHADADRIGFYTALSLYHMKEAAQQARHANSDGGSSIASLFGEYFGGELGEMTVQGELYEAVASDTGIDHLVKAIPEIDTGGKRKWTIHLSQWTQHYKSLESRVVTVGNTFKLEITNVRFKGKV